MSEFVAEFDVSSRLTEQTYHCRFSHLWNGVATRHSVRHREPTLLLVV